MSKTKEERDIDVLLKQNEEKINKLRESIKEIYDEKVHDEIFLLRYCLSHDKVEDAEKSLRFAIDYREKNKEWLKEAVNGETSAPLHEKIMQFSCSSIHKTKTNDGGPIVIIRAGHSDPKLLMDNFTGEQICNYLVFQKEVCYVKKQIKFLVFYKLNFFFFFFFFAFSVVV